MLSGQAKRLSHWRINDSRIIAAGLFHSRGFSRVFDWRVFQAQAMNKDEPQSDSYLIDFANAYLIYKNVDIARDIARISRTIRHTIERDSHEIQEKTSSD